MRLYQLLLLLLLSFSSYADDADCVFNSSLPSAVIVKNIRAVKSYVWNAKDNIATALLSNGDLLYIKQWSCTHAGLKARLFVSSDLDLSHQNYWIHKVLWLGQQVLSPQDYQKLQQACLNQHGEIQATDDTLLITIADEICSEFTVTINSLDNDIKSITLFYYFG